MVSKRANKNLFKWLFPLMICCCLVLIISRPSNSKAQPDINPNIAFVEFWSDYQSIFLYHPNLVKQVFMGIVDLKGNRRVARKYIKTEILSCKNGSGSLSECRLDQLKIERRKRKTSRYITVPVNITSIYGHPFKKDKSRYVLTISWQPEMLQPPVISIAEFYSYLGVANESKYYSGKKGLERIQINALFEDQVTIVTSKARAKNMLNLYHNPPSDLKDAFVFRVDAANVERYGSTANVDLQLKAVKVKINHLMYKTTKELLQ